MFKNKKVFLAVLVAVLALVYFGFRISAKPQPDLIIKEVGLPLIVPSQPATNEASRTAAKKPALVDPFSLRLSVTSKIAGQGGETTAGGGPKLEGIWYNSELRAAFISGNVVTEGESVSGWRVRRIYKDRVELVKQNELMTLKLEDVYNE